MCRQTDERSVKLWCFLCVARGSSGVFSRPLMPPASLVGLKARVSGIAASREAGGHLVCSGSSMSATG